MELSSWLDRPEDDRSNDDPTARLDFFSAPLGVRQLGTINESVRKSWTGSSRPSTCTRHRPVSTWLAGTSPAMTAERWRKEIDVDGALIVPTVLSRRSCFSLLRRIPDLRVTS